MKEKVLEVTALKKIYPNFKLDINNFSLETGEIRALLGRNGAGKTTFLQILLHQLSYNSGEIIIFQNNSLTAQTKNYIGFASSEIPFVPLCFSAKDINNVFKYIYSSWNSSLYFSLLESFHVDSKKKLSELSTGMKVKVNLSLALAHQPKLLILDEITSGLDPIARKEILSFLKKSNSDQKTTILFSTHIIEDLENFADTISVIKNGNLFCTEKFQQIKTIAKNENTALIDFINSILEEKNVGFNY